MFKFITLASVIAFANAACDNACSGHGTCNYEDICTCFPNWRLGGETAGDCSDRVCPFDIAWVDTPSLNSDIELTVDVASKGNAHRYAECSGRGLCDRETGLCGCFDGFTGDACQRTTCPNDCNGHGTCEFIEDLGYGANFGAYNDGSAFAKGFFGEKPQNFTGDIAAVNFDAGKTRQCVCDAGYSGADCSMRNCPFGNDVLDKDSTNGGDNQIQRIHMVLDTGYSSADGSGPGMVDVPQSDTATDLGKVQNFALAFTSKLGERFVTRPIRLPSVVAGSDSTAGLTALATFVKEALLELPNKVIDSVTVAAYASDGHTDAGSVNEGKTGDGAQTKITVNTVQYSMLQYTIDITFDGNNVQGNQHLLEVLTEECSSGNIRVLDKDSGCTPQLNGVEILQANIAGGTYAPNSVAGPTFSGVAMRQTSELNSYECGRRGKCDYETGICQCFGGYKGAHCEGLTALL